MDGKADSVPAGTGQVVELNGIYNRVIKELRNLVAIRGKNGYHGIV
ncbi:MAG: hypothetical protein HFH14_06160 [Lachnospiraceae bacterium]|nr:hypothetical protein [Lachnospiraceae bacterium]